MIMGVKYWDKPQLFVTQARSAFANFQASSLGQVEMALDIPAAATASINIMLGMKLLVETSEVRWRPLPEDLLTLYLNDPRNARTFNSGQNIDRSSLVGFRISQFYPIALKEVFGVKAEYFSELSFQDSAIEVAKGCGVQIVLKEPDRDLAVVAYDDESQELMAIPSVESRWPEHKVPVLRINKRTFADKVHKSFIVFRQ